MKITTRVFLLALAGLLLARCDLERLPLNGPEVGYFPSTEREAFYGLMGAYKGLSLMTAASTPWILVIDNSTDIGFTRPGNNYTPQLTSSLSADNTLTSKLWREIYQTIGRCHLVLDNLPVLKGKIDDDTYALYDAELRVIRAYYYAHLIEFYGDAPLVKRSLTPAEAMVPRDSKDTIVRWLLDELEEVRDNLKDSYPGYGTGRATRVAAYMLRARVALNHGFHAIAAADAGRAIELSAGLHALEDYNRDFTNVDHDTGEPACTNLFGYRGHESSREWIWCIQYNRLIDGNSTLRSYYMLSRLGAGCSYFGPTQAFVDSFQCLDGKQIDESPLYDWQHPWRNRDPRLDLFCACPGSRLFNIQFETDNDVSADVYTFAIDGSITTTNRREHVWSYNPDPRTPTGHVDGIPNQDATNSYAAPGGYLWRKHTDIADLGDNRNCDLDCPIFRYAELLLIYAEAKIESNAIDGTELDAINAIRVRVGMPSHTPVSDQVTLRRYLRYERKIELCNEGVRWFDIRRWHIVEGIMKDKPLYGSNKKRVS